MTTNQESLSVVLSVHNAEKTLSRQITQLLDMLPDLAQQFELLILDDGSTDQTEEVAHELARDYPQLRVARHETRLGADAGIQTALKKTTGNVVVLQGDARPEDLRQALENRRNSDATQRDSADQDAAPFQSKTTGTRSYVDPGADSTRTPRKIRRERKTDWIIARRADMRS